MVTEEESRELGEKTTGESVPDYVVKFSVWLINRATRKDMIALLGFIVGGIEHASTIKELKNKVKMRMEELMKQ